VILRRDHVGGGAFVVIGAVILALSGDLPFGTLASPGAGMLPKLAVGLMMLLGLVLLARAGESPPFADLAFADLPHALRVVIVAAVSVALYTTLGFAASMSVMLFALVFAIERRPIVYAAAFSAGVTLIAYLLFNRLLKSPLPGGVIWF
jgi:hypothetical protein